MNLKKYQKKYNAQLFENLIPFWLDMGKTVFHLRDTVFYYIIILRSFPSCGTLPERHRYPQDVQEGDSYA